jgi:hypothetical protein
MYYRDRRQRSGGFARRVLLASLLPLVACGLDIPEDPVMDPDQREAILSLPDGPVARPEDVVSPEAIVQAVYASISGPAEVEQERDWDRLRSLFLPNARFVLVRWQSPDGEESKVLRSWNVERFIETAKGFYQETAFYEREVAREVDRFGNMAQVFSTYESRVVSEDSDPVSRGINSIQVVFAEDRWWIAHLVWDVERTENPIPQEYL